MKKFAKSLVLVLGLVVAAASGVGLMYLLDDERPVVPSSCPLTISSRSGVTTLTLTGWSEAGGPCRVILEKESS